MEICAFPFFVRCTAISLGKKEGGALGPLLVLKCYQREADRVWAWATHISASGAAKREEERLYGLGNALYRPSF